MNKTILKILISTLILLIGIGAVSAIEHNSTDEFLSVEQTNEVSLMEDNTEVISIAENDTDVLSSENNNTVIFIAENDTDVLSSENNNTVIFIAENDTDVLSSENNNTVIFVCENNIEVISIAENFNDVLSSENNNTAISISNDDDLISLPSTLKPDGTQSESEFKSIYLGKLKFQRKFKNMALYGYDVPSKKNKKAWKKHKAYQKAEKKQVKKFRKQALKFMDKAKVNHWHTDGDYSTKLKYRGKYVYILIFADCYRIYNYHPTYGGWWD